MAKNFYEDLQVSEKASAKEIEAAFRELSRENDPLDHPGDQLIEEKYKRIVAAHDVLSHPIKRQDYNALLWQQRHNNASPSNATPPATPIGVVIPPHPPRSRRVSQSTAPVVPPPPTLESCGGSFSKLAVETAAYDQVYNKGQGAAQKRSKRMFSYGCLTILGVGFVGACLEVTALIIGGIHKPVTILPGAPGSPGTGEFWSKHQVNNGPGVIPNEPVRAVNNFALFSTKELNGSGNIKPVGSAKRGDVFIVKSVGQGYLGLQRVENGKRSNNVFYATGANGFLTPDFSVVVQRESLQSSKASSGAKAPHLKM
jgi:hypothetical protein